MISELIRRFVFKFTANAMFECQGSGARISAMFLHALKKRSSDVRLLNRSVLVTWYGVLMHAFKIIF